MTFDELSTLKQPSASLRTALDKISAALGSVGDAGQQARSVVDELRVSLRAAAAQSVKSARSLAKFDEINRLSAPAEDKTAALEKQQKAAEAAAKAEKAARSTAARRSGKGGRVPRHRGPRKFSAEKRGQGNLTCRVARFGKAHRVHANAAYAAGAAVHRSRLILVFRERGGRAR